MFQRLGEKLRRFMYGRYGSDRLNTVLLITAIVLCLVSSFTKRPYIGLVAYVPMFFALFRMYSRNIYKRRRENQRFLQLFTPLRDREHRYFSCPRCRQRVRVPRGKGTIVIKCPACAERFQKKT